MLRETSVIAVAGIRRLFIVCWAIACLGIALIFIVIGTLKLLGLIGAMAMLTIEGMVPAEDAAQNATVHVIFMLLFFALGVLFAYLARRAERSLTRPFEQDIKNAAELVSNVESNARSNARSLRDITRSAVSEAKSRRDEAQ